MIRDFCDYSRKVAELQLSAITAAEDVRQAAENELDDGDGSNPISAYAQSLVRSLSIPVICQSITELARCSAHRGEVPALQHCELYPSEVRAWR